jgi:hypothetical protein
MLGFRDKLTQGRINDLLQNFTGKPVVAAVFDRNGYLVPKKGKSPE